MNQAVQEVRAKEMGSVDARFVATVEGYNELIRRAWNLVPLITENAAEAEGLGRTPDVVLDALHASGLFKILRPALFGGYAQRSELLFEVGSILARGCMSTAWVFVNLAIHDLYVANWSVEAQNEVWKSSPDTLIGSTFVFPAGSAKRCEGGYMLSGRWPFSSGVHPCQWNIVGAIVRGDDGEVLEQRYFLLKREQYAIVDNWHVEALRGTGSADVEAKDVFVPDYLTLDYLALLQGQAEGAKIHNDPAVAYPFAASGGFVLLCAIYGAARGTLDSFVDKARDAVARSSGKPLAAEPTYQSKVAEASALIDTVELMVRNAFRSIESDLAEGKSFTGKNAMKLRRDSAFCVKLSLQAIDILFGLGGGSALYKENPLQRAWRDIHGGSAHIVFQWDIHGVAYGRVELGLPSGLPGMQI